MYRTSEDTQKRKDAKRQLLLDAAAKVFSAKGYHNTTVKDIISAADVSVGGFYFYFKSKDDLFTELYLSIAEKFNAISLLVVDVDSFSMLKNFTRVMTATLWTYERHREIAKIMLLDAALTEAKFQQLRMAGFKETARVMAQWFQRFKKHDGVNIPDERIASLLYAGSYYLLVTDWLESGANEPLTKQSFAFCVYNLQALSIPFEAQAVKAYISEVLTELACMK